MPRDSRLSRPEDYLPNKSLSKFLTSRGFNKKIDYGEAFKSKPTEPPFNINRFEQDDLQKNLTKGLAKKETLNPRLNFVGGDPAAFKLFTGLPRFDNNRKELYDFNEGRPNTVSKFTEYPDFKPIWAELYNSSPTVAEQSSNPMPSKVNPDPKGIIQSRAEQAAASDIEGNLSIAQLLQGDGAATVADGAKGV